MKVAKISVTDFFNSHLGEWLDSWNSAWRTYLEPVFDEALRVVKLRVIKELTLGRTALQRLRKKLRHVKTSSSVRKADNDIGHRVGSEWAAQLTG